MKIKLLVTLTIPILISSSLVLARTYGTNFPLNEDPISEGGDWTNGKSAGLDWANVATLSGQAYGRQSSPGAFADSTALLTGSWGADQTAYATVYSVNQNDSIFEEVEIRLRSAISTHSITGYEINFSARSSSNAYVQIVRWNGPLGNWTLLDGRGGSAYGIKTGDVIKGSVAGNLITAYINDVPVLQVTDNTYSTGNPGIGFYLDGTSVTSVQRDYGFTSFVATDGLPPPPKSRTFVSSSGNDFNDCSVTAPCRSFNAAIALTNSGGEVVAIDSAAYGSATILKPLAITAPTGVYAGITASSGTAIVVNPGSGIVSLRGLTLNGLGGNVGIDYQSGDELWIEGVTIRGFASSGINVTNAAAKAIFIRNTTLRDNASGATFAPPIGATGPLVALIERSHLSGNATGVSFSGNSVNAAIRDIDIVGGNVGVAATPGVSGAKIAIDLQKSLIDGTVVSCVQVGNGLAGTSAIVNMVRSLLSHGGVALSVGNGGQVFASEMTIMQNGTGISLSGGGTAVSSGDNRLANNAFNGSFSSTLSKN